MSNNKGVYVGPSRIDGIGVFANRDYRKGDVLFVIKGTIRDFVIKSRNDSLTGANWIGLGKGKWIDPVAPACYLNHSCEPSSGIKGRVTVVALRDIQPREEITIDYSITEMDSLWEMRCRCGAATCRRRIRSIQHLEAQTFIRYIPYVPTYFAMVYFKQKHG